MKIAIDSTAKYISQSGITSYLNGILDFFDEQNITQFNCHTHYANLGGFEKKAYTLYRELYWQQYELPRLVKKNNCDILFSPSHNLCLNPEITRVVTFHDFYLLRNPKSFTKWHRWYGLHYYPKIINSGCNIIVISKFTESELYHFFPKIKGRVKVIYNAVSDEWRVIKDNLLLNSIRIKYSLPEQFLLAVGSVEPRKNLSTIFRCLAIDEKLPPLVLISSGGWNNKCELEMIFKLQSKGRLIWLRNLPREDLIVIYNLARVFIYPSLYEGMGAPPLEAMSCGCPVITSNNTSLKELYSDSAYLVNPLNIDNILSSLHEVLESELLRNAMIDKGINLKKKFSFSKVAIETLKYFEEVV